MKGRFTMADAPPDRRHNREEDSPEALRRSIEALAEAIGKMDRRLDEVELRLEGRIEDGRDTTRRLATEVGLMGEALLRRIETQNSVTVSAKHRRNRLWPIAFLLALGAMLAVSGFAFVSGSR
jgi:hypothetical protein